MLSCFKKRAERKKRQEQDGRILAEYDLIRQTEYFSVFKALVLANKTLKLNVRTGERGGWNPGKWARASLSDGIMLYEIFKEQYDLHYTLEVQTPGCKYEYQTRSDFPKEYAEQLFEFTRNNKTSSLIEKILKKNETEKSPLSYLYGLQQQAGVKAK